MPARPLLPVDWPEGDWVDHLAQLTESERIIWASQGLPADAQVFLAEVFSLPVNSTLAQSPLLHFKAQSVLVRSTSNNVLAALAQNPVLRPSLQLRLAQLPSPSTHAALAQNTALCERAQMLLLARSGEYVCSLLATNPALTTGHQQRLRHHLHSVRQALAGNPSLAPELQSDLASSTDQRARVALAGNPGLLVPFQRLLSKNGDTQVREVLARNPSLAPRLQASLSFDPHPLVQLALSQNPAFQLTGHTSALFCYLHRYSELTALLTKENLQSEWMSIVLQWQGTLASLLKALRLLA